MTKNRDFAYKNLLYLSELMVGTVGFVGECYYKYAILDKNEATARVLVIGQFSFGVTQVGISKVLHKIENR